MLAQMPVRLWLGWCHYFELEPFGANEQARWHSLLAVAYHNVHRRPGSALYDAGDFFPQLKERRQRQTAEQQKTMMAAWCRAVGGTVNGG